ncbi:MAG TPA: hypothetical protein VHA11_00060 [Bryobacteraceae bacterium]|nr:hypothetical protein [Bryobacteraceae bacterium]
MEQSRRGAWKMAPRNTPQACLERARAGILLAQEALLKPNADALDRCSVCLRAVGDHLRSFSRLVPKTGAARPELRAAAEVVRADLLHLNTMLGRAAAMYQGWIKLLSSKKCGYTRRGAPAQLTCTQQFVVKG